MHCDYVRSVYFLSNSFFFFFLFFFLIENSNDSLFTHEYVQSSIQAKKPVLFSEQPRKLAVKIGSE